MSWISLQGQFAKESHKGPYFSGYLDPESNIYNKPQDVLLWMSSCSRYSPIMCDHSWYSYYRYFLFFISDISIWVFLSFLFSTLKLDVLSARSINIFVVILIFLWDYSNIWISFKSVYPLIMVFCFNFYFMHVS